MLGPAAIKQFYDRFGGRQDGQAFYEDRALDDLRAHAAFAEARTIAELGCGTGRFAARILTACPEAAYVGFDVSTTMLRLARSSLARFGERASVRRAITFEGSPSPRTVDAAAALRRVIR